MNESTLVTEQIYTDPVMHKEMLVIDPSNSVNQLLAALLWDVRRKMAEGLVEVHPQSSHEHLGISGGRLALVVDLIKHGSGESGENHTSNVADRENFHLRVILSFH